MLKINHEQAYGTLMFNPFKQSGISHSCRLELYGVFSLFFYQILMELSGDPDQMPHFVAFDLGLHCF